MTIQDWGAIGEVIGAIGIIATLIYLSIQIRQTRDVVRGSTIQARSDSAIAQFTAMSTSPDLVKVLVGDLKIEGGEDEFRLRSFFMLGFKNMENAFLQHNLGIYTWPNYQEGATVRRWFTTYVSVSGWWEESRHFFDSGFREYVDEIVERGT